MEQNDEEQSVQNIDVIIVKVTSKSQSTKINNEIQTNKIFLNIFKFNKNVFLFDLRLSVNQMSHQFGN